MKNRRTTFLSDTKWLLSEFAKVFYNPIGVAGGFIDATRGWKFSRIWWRVWLHTPFVVLLCSAYGASSASLFRSVESQIQALKVESEGRCTTVRLENNCNEIYESDFSKAVGLSQVLPDKPLEPLSELTIRNVELFARRAISVDPTNQDAHFRLALIYLLSGRNEQGRSELQLLASGKFGVFPQASAWLAKDDIVRKTRGEDVSLVLLMSHLEQASQWKDCDARLLYAYSYFLHATGDVVKSTVLANKASIANPEFNLHLARLYALQKDEKSLRATAYVVEDVFGKRLNSKMEKDADRLAVAEVKKLTDRLEEAETVLQEGLDLRPSSMELRRELSEVQRLLYTKSILQREDGGVDADLILLEKAGTTDPSNPNIISDIAKLLPMKIKPTKPLMELLRTQIAAGKTNVQTHLLLAQGFVLMDNMKEALKNWEIVIAKEPNNIGALNNLALGLAMDSPANCDRSLALISKALELSPNNAEFLDSLGDILVIAKRPLEAINKFELAVRVDKSRVQTRRKLVRVYQSLGMEDMAKTQSRVIEMIESQKTKQ